MVRLKDIALRAGVSVMTVSKAVNDAKDIAPATKVRIRALAEQMGYVPNHLARSLRCRTTRLLGLIIPTLANPIYARMVMAIEQRCADTCFDLLVAQSLNLPEREEQLIRRMRARRVDGLFIAPAPRLPGPAPIFDEIHAVGLPTVILGQRPPHAGTLPAAEVEEITASQNLTKLMIGLGHRRIAYSPARTYQQVVPSASKDFAAPFAKLVWNGMTALSFQPVQPSKKGQKPPAKCLTKT